MIWLYRIIFPILLVLVYPFYWRKIRRRGGYGGRFRDRFGLYPDFLRERSLTGCIWIQAVSVGEVNAVVPLVHRVIKKYPNHPVVVTTTTSTGFAVAQARLQHVCTVALFPLDWVFFSRRAWDFFRPSLALLMEGEIWPEHIRQAGKRKVPVVIINARLSDRSYHRYRRFRFFARPLWNGVSAIYASSEEDQKRLRAVVPEEIKVQATGNLKFDVLADTELDLRRKVKMKARLGLGNCSLENPDEPLLLLGSSTWPGEEMLLLNLWQRWRNSQKRPSVQLLLVPRHAERRQEIIQQMEAMKIPFSVRSRGESPGEVSAVYLVDTTGELADFTSVADLAFIGKSIPPNEGGQTPIEAAAYGVPMVYGPKMSNFRSVCFSLEQQGAALRCNNQVEVEKILLRLLANEKERKILSQKALAWHEQHRGASDFISGDLEKFLDT